jgi:hypothetical protein
MNTAPPIIARGSPRNRNTWFAAVLLAVAALGAAAVLYCFDPATHGFYPVCRFHQWTGWNCPGCGATRAAYALLHGNLTLALRDNALLTLAPVALLVRAGWLAVARWSRRPVPVLIPANGIWAAVAIALVFAILRNLPAFAFLSPA